MAGWAVALWAVYGLAAFAGRLILQRVTTGSWGFSGIQGGALAWVGGLLFVLALGTSVTGAVLQQQDVVDPIDFLDARAAYAAGFVLYGFGLAGTLGAQIAMGASWRIGVGEGEQTEMVSTGPFELVRNPIYLAMFATVAGVFLLAPNCVALAGFLVLVVALEVQVRMVEEPHLLRTHGDAYRDYTARVGRFLPGIGRRR